MTPLEHEVRAALRATAATMPPGPPPPLKLPSRHRRLGPRPRGRWSGHRWSGHFWSGHRWAGAVTAVVLIAAVLAGLLTLASVLGGRRGPVSFPPAPLHVPDVPAYYVALSSADGNAPGFSARTTTATIRATATGKVLATIPVPRPYHAFTGVTAASDDRSFVLVAADAPNARTSIPGPSRFYVLHFDPASHTAAGRVRLRALPASYIPAGSFVLAMALSPDSSSLAAIIGTSRSSELYAYHLPTGKPHVWSWSACSNCGGDGLGPGSSGPDPGILSWAADGRTVAFMFFFSGASGNGVRLLDTNAGGSDVLADSKLAIPWPDVSSPVWRRMIITPDGRTIFAVLENDKDSLAVSEQLVRFSVPTRRQTTLLNQLPVGEHLEQIQWTNPTGSVLLISGADHGGGAGVFTAGHYTPIPWSSRIFAAAW